MGIVRKNKRSVNARTILIFLGPNKKCVKKMTAEQERE